MRTFNDESMILDEFRDLHKSEIAFVGSELQCYMMHKSLTSIFNRRYWINSSKKSDPPPDYYNDNKKLMMEFMRIDDHAYIDEKGKVVNPELQHEGEIIRKYFNQPERDDINLFIIPNTNLPTDEDHDFKKYFENFKRVINKHNNKINLYNLNHPGYKTIFFILDESSAYFEYSNGEDEIRNRKEGSIVHGRPHFYWMDSEFLEVIRNTEVDYFVWYAPFKLIRLEKGKIFELPKAAIIDVKNIKKSKFIDFNHDKLVSIEL